MNSSGLKSTYPVLLAGGGSIKCDKKHNDISKKENNVFLFGGGSSSCNIKHKVEEEVKEKDDLHIGYDIGLKEGLKKGIVDTINKILKSFFYDNEIEGNVNTSSKEDGYETIITSVPFVDISQSSIFKIYTSIIIDDEYNLKYKVTIYFFMKDDSLYEKISEITELNIHNLLTYLSEQINFYIQ